MNMDRRARTPSGDPFAGVRSMRVEPLNEIPSTFVRLDEIVFLFKHEHGISAMAERAIKDGGFEGAVTGYEAFVLRWAIDVINSNLEHFNQRARGDL